MGDLKAHLASAALAQLVKDFSTCHPRYESNATQLRDMAQEILDLRAKIAALELGKECVNAPTPKPKDDLPDELDVDGHVDARGIRYIGKAARQSNGLWLCLAEVGGALCRVEVNITALTPAVFQPQHIKES